MSSRKRQVPRNRRNLVPRVGDDGMIEWVEGQDYPMTPDEAFVWLKALAEADSALVQAQQTVHECEVLYELALEQRMATARAIERLGGTPPPLPKMMEPDPWTGQTPTR